MKVSFNKYLQGYGTAGLAASPNPIATLVTNTTRVWTDSDRDYTPDCDLLSPDANGECGGLVNRAFGTPVPGSTFDPNLMTGWGKRENNYEFTAGVQREVFARTSLDVSYFRRWYGNLLVTDNMALAPTDFDTFSMPVPNDPRLDNAGGRVTGLYNIKQDKFGVPAQNFVTLAKNYGDQVERFDGIDVNLNAPDCATASRCRAASARGKSTYDNCEIVAKVPEMLQGASIMAANPGGAVWSPAQFCRQVSPFLTQFKGLGSYNVPKIDVRLSATYQSLPGPHITANYVATQAEVLPNLGRPLVGAANITFNMAEPGKHLRRAAAPDGPALRQAGSLQRPDRGVQRRPLQRLQRQPRGAVEQQLRRLADAAGHPAVAVREAERAAGFLTGSRLRAPGSRSQLRRPEPCRPRFQGSWRIPVAAGIDSCRERAGPGR